MGNYISRDEFAKYLADIQYGEATTGRTGENIDYQNGVYAGLDMAYVALKRFPAADVVEVVRCKDCRYFHNGYDEKCCINHKGVVVTDENGFCHHAERRADDG